MIDLRSNQKARLHAKSFVVGGALAKSQSLRKLAQNQRHLPSDFQ